MYGVEINLRYRSGKSAQVAKNRRAELAEAMSSLELVEVCPQTFPAVY